MSKELILPRSVYSIIRNHFISKYDYVSCEKINKNTDIIRYMSSEGQINIKYISDYEWFRQNKINEGYIAGGSNPKVTFDRSMMKMTGEEVTRYFSCYDFSYSNTYILEGQTPNKVLITDLTNNQLMVIDKNTYTSTYIGWSISQKENAIQEILDEENFTSIIEKYDYSSDATLSSEQKTEINLDIDDILKYTEKDVKSYHEEGDNAWILIKTKSSPKLKESWKKKRSVKRSKKLKSHLELKKTENY